jgi:hypothetical protein
MFCAMEQELRNNLRTCFDAYAKVTGRSMVTISQAAAGDWRFYRRLDGPTTFTARKYDEVIAWFAANWPAGWDLPEVIRSAPTSEAAE